MKFSKITKACGLKETKKKPVVTWGEIDTSAPPDEFSVVDGKLVLTKTTKARPLQEFVLEQIRKAGGHAFVCCSLASAHELMTVLYRQNSRGHFVAIELKRGTASSESDLKRRVLTMIHAEFPNAWVYKTNDRFTSGIPDLIICLG